MRKSNLDIKKIIKKRIEERHKNLIFIQKEEKRTNAPPKIIPSIQKPNPRVIDLSKLSGKDRTALRVGMLNNTYTGEHSVFREHYRIENTKKNLIYGVTTFNRIDFLKKTIESWYSTINKEHNWTLIIADDNSTDGTIEYATNLKLDNIKIILIRNLNRGVHYQTNQIFRIASQLDFDFAFKSDDDVLFLQSGWDDLYINAIRKTGYEHLIFYDKTWGARRNELRNPIIKDSILENVVSTMNLQGAFWTFTKNVIENVGYFDIKSFNLCGLGHIDFSHRCCRLGFNNIETPFDIVNSNDYIKLNNENYYTTNHYNELWNTREKIVEKKEIIIKDRKYIPYNVSKQKMNGNPVYIRKGTIREGNEINYINEYFDHIYCINLDRRYDRWVKIVEKFKFLNIHVKRVSAVDGSKLDRSIREQYKMISAGALGCILSHYKIIQHAKKCNYRRILILEDDILFIENFHKHFIDMMKSINDWCLLYLGCSQHVWQNIEFYNENNYYSKRCDGTFAYSIDCSVFDDVLNTDTIKDKPIDTILHIIQNKYYKNCFTAFPNLIISDVSESDIRSPRDNERHKIKMKWNLAKYV